LGDGAGIHECSGSLGTRGNREYPFGQYLATMEGFGVRYVYIGLMIVALAVVILFKVQNLTSVTGRVRIFV
jgi:hypothetical protein